MHPLDNKHMETLQCCIGEGFKESLVEQIIRERDSVFGEICQETNITDYQNVRAVNLAKKTVTQDKLDSWLETVCCILDSFAVPLLENGKDLLDCAGNLKAEDILLESKI